MMIRRNCVLLLLLLVSSGAAQPRVARLWAVSDGVRVDPVDGRIFEARPDIHKDYPANDFRTANSVWDGTSRTVSLKAARNEFVAFQVVIEAQQPITDVSVRFNGVAGPRGVHIGGRYAAVFKEWYVHVRQSTTGYERSSLGPGWYPDALMPERHTQLYSSFPFSIPDLYNDIPGQKNQTLWIDLFVPNERAAAPQGRYTGDLDISWKGGRDSIKVALEVWDFALPQENHLAGDIWNGSIKEMQPDEELAYYQLARQHRFLPLVYAYRPGLKISGTNVTLDWTDYDRRLAPYLDGSAFTAQHGY